MAHQPAVGQQDPDLIGLGLGVGLDFVLLEDLHQRSFEMHLDNVLYLGKALVKWDGGG